MLFSLMPPYMSIPYQSAPRISKGLQYSINKETKTHAFLIWEGHHWGFTLAPSHLDLATWQCELFLDRLGFRPLSFWVSITMSHHPWVPFWKDSAPKLCISSFERLASVNIMYCRDSNEIGSFEQTRLLFDSIRFTIRTPHLLNE